MAGSAHHSIGWIRTDAGCSHLSGEGQHRPASKRIQSSLWCCWIDPFDTTGNPSTHTASNSVATNLSQQRFEGKYKLNWSFFSSFLSLNHTWHPFCCLLFWLIHDFDYLFRLKSVLFSKSFNFANHVLHMMFSFYPIIISVFCFYFFEEKTPKSKLIPIFFFHFVSAESILLAATYHKLSVAAWPTIRTMQARNEADNHQLSASNSTSSAIPIDPGASHSNGAARQSDWIHWEFWRCYGRGGSFGTFTCRRFCRQFNRWWQFDVWFIVMLLAT